MKRINKILIGLILIASMFLGIGYSAISNITLDITGSIIAEGKKAVTTPYIPRNFIEVEGTSLETGYTIEDSSGNQYVWVVVPRDTTVYSEEMLELDLEVLSETELANAYTTIETELHNYTSTYRNKTTYTDIFYSTNQHGFEDADAYNEHKNKMLASVFKYGGFYVGKYETGTNTARLTSKDALTTPVIQQNAYPYNYVKCIQAQTLASEMESGEYTSSLMFGVQWDLILRYLESKGFSQNDLNVNSKNLGNYINNYWTITNLNSKYYETSWVLMPYGPKGNSDKGILLSTGASDKFSQQGIYDLGGNVYEWTLEHSNNTTYPCVNRGGRYKSYGSGGPLSNRNYDEMNISVDFYGFRVTIF